MKLSIPVRLKSLFWDIDPVKLDVKRHRAFVIERVLEHGDEAAIAWLFKTFSRTAIASVTKASRRLSPKSRDFWSFKLGIWRQHKPLTRKPAVIWKH
ncbi:hypothetical protein HYZ80_00170 [Candidatus Parcubacteria bacterium]|nr:hypothetical protein [Candidatus Parcubacteria bacterium]